MRGTRLQPAVQRDEGPACRAMGHQQIVRGTRVQPAVQRGEGPACRAMGHQQIVRRTRVQPAVQRDEGPDCRAMGHQQIVRGTMVQPAVQRDEGLIWIACFHVHSTDVACPRSQGSLGDVNLNQAVALCSTKWGFSSRNIELG